MYAYNKQIYELNGKYNSNFYAKPYLLDIFYRFMVNYMLQVTRLTIRQRKDVE